MHSAFADHGEVHPTLGTDASEAERMLADVEAAGIDLARITQELELEGVESFCASYHELLSCIESKLEQSALTPRG